MDQFIGELTNALSQLDEDVILVMYGDHLPTMDLTVTDLTNRYLFQTQYVIWDNMGLEKQDKNLAAYQMAAEVMDRVGIHEGNVFRFHQARKNTKDYQVDLEMLQYDILYGERYVYDGETPYEKTAMRLGVVDTEFDSIEEISEGRYYIRGANFTQSSYLEVNGELIEATFIDENTLLVITDALKDGDEVDIATRSNSSTHRVLTRTDTYIYHEPDQSGQEAVLTPAASEEDGQEQSADTEKTETQEAQTEENQEE